MDVFKSNKALVEECWRTNDNYSIRDIASENRNCLILFSSNGLYDKSGMSINSFIKIRDWLTQEALL